MEIETVGENAGKVWRNLNENRGEISIQELSRKMNLSAIDVAIAIINLLERKKLEEVVPKCWHNLFNEIIL